MASPPSATERAITIPLAEVSLAADLAIPASAVGVVAFAHGSGSSRHSPRNRRVAERLGQGGLGTLLLDLLTEDEERRDSRTGELRFDIGLLARRLVAAVDWLGREQSTEERPIGLFGASTGAAAALIAAATHLFEEPGALETVADLACEWFITHLAGRGEPP